MASGVAADLGSSSSTGVGFGIETVKVAVRAKTGLSSVTDTVVTRTTGVRVDYSAAGFQAPPAIRADVIAVSSGSPDDYYVTGKATATATSATLRIRHRRTNRYVTGTIRWHGFGII